jgi:hypothetical protein
MPVKRVGDSPRRGTAVASSGDPRLQIGAYITDGVRLLRALGERDKEGRWPYEDCMHPRNVVKLTAGEVGTCTLVALAKEETDYPLTGPAPETHA